MIVDRKSRPWIILCLVLFLAATALYVPYARGINGPSGGSWPGLIYGIAGSLCILVAMALSPRKKFRTMRVGRAFYWMQAHVWFGLLSYPLILYHAGFSWGGSLTSVLMWLFTLIIVSGVVGLILQQFMPARLLRQVPAETIYEQIDHVLGILRDEAAAAVKNAALRVERPAYDLEVVPAGGASVAAVASDSEAPTMLEDFYTREVEPFLQSRPRRDSALADESSANSAFRHMRSLLPPEMHEALADVQAIVEERRQLERQRRMHLVLHGWLLVHVPLSFAMIVLAIIHAVMALRFTSLG